MNKEIEKSSLRSNDKEKSYSLIGFRVNLQVELGN